MHPVRIHPLLIALSLLGISLGGPGAAAIAHAEETAPETGRPKDPYVAGILAEFFPGAGYLYLGEARAAGMSAGLLGPLLAPYYVTPTTAVGAGFLDNGYVAARNFFGFTVYDSFQDGLDARGRPPQPVEIPHYTFGELYAAPFDSANYDSWKVWVPLSGTLAYLGYRLLNEGVTPGISAGHALVSIPLIFAMSFLVGTGEESEFRGFQYPAFSKLTDSTIWGSALQSVSFGLCHTGVGICSSPYFIGTAVARARGFGPGDTTSAQGSPDVSDFEYFLGAAVFGAYESWIVSSESDGLKKAVVLHGLWDGVYFLGSFLTRGAALNMTITLKI